MWGAGVLIGRVNPSGRLPVQIPTTPGGQPGTYLHPPLGGDSHGVSNLDPTAEQIATDQAVKIACLVRNTGDRTGTEGVQLCLDDPIAQLARPVIQLAGFARVTL